MPKHDEVVIEEAPEEGDVVSLDESEEPSEDDGFPEYDIESPNIALDWAGSKEGIEELKELANKVLGDFDDGFDATEEYREKMKSDWEMFTGNLPPKTFPYADCANVHVPIMIENVTRNTFRAFSEIFGDWHNVFGAEPVGPAGREDALLVSLHSNWQVREQIPDFKRQMHRLTLAFFAIGDVTVHSYFDTERKQNRHEVLTPDDFVVPFTYTSTMPDYSDVPWRARVVHLYRHQLQARLEDWFGVDKLLDGTDPSFEDEPEHKLSDSVAQVQGQDTTETAPYKVIWYEGWLELPKQPTDRFCRVLVDYRTRTVLELVVLEEPAWQDVERFNSQQQELDQYRMQLEQHQQQIQQQTAQVAQTAQMALDAGDQLGPEQKGAIANQLTQAVQIQPTPPVAPTWMKNPDDIEETPEPPRREPVHLFTHFVCIEPLVGTLGLGYGRIQGDFNRAANTALNQFCDAATLANVGILLKSANIQFPEKTELKPGAIINVDGVTGPDIKDNIMELRGQPPASELVQVVDKIYGYGQSSMQAPSVLSGEPGKSGETYRGIATRVEQATKQLSVTTRKLGDSLEYVAKANAALNRIYLSDEEIISVAMQRGQPPAAVKIGRHIYDRGYKFMITADLRFTSQSQRVQEADELFQLVKNVPQLQQNINFMYAITKMALEARERPELIQYLGPDPGPPQTVFGTPPPAPPPQPGQPQRGQTPPQGGGPNPNQQPVQRQQPPRAA
jgi:hypothetical protein